MKLKASELRDLSAEELSAKKAAAKKELFDLRYQMRLGRVEKPHRMRQAKREIARIETVLNERKEKR